MRVHRRLFADAQSAILISAKNVCLFFFFFFSLSAGLSNQLRVHPSVLQYFAPVLIIFNVFAPGLTGMVVVSAPFC